MRPVGALSADYADNMASNFPNQLDSLTNPSPTQSLDDPTVDHAAQHANANDAIEAIEARIGIAGSTDAASIEKRLTDAVGATEAVASGLTSHLSGTGVHAIAAVTGLQTALDGKSSTGHDHLATYAPIANGVTNGDSHDHNGGDGAQIAYSSLSGLPTLGSAASTSTEAYEPFGAVSTHAALTTTHGISSFGSTLVDDTSASVARTTLGLGGAATLSVGTTTGTVAAGDDARIVASTAAETTTTIGSLIASATAKTTPVDADQMALMDSAASNILKKLSWANIKIALQSTFATLAGVAGGQTLRGGTAASETLTLQSTAHATKGTITALPLTIDEINLRVGIGQTTPSAALHLKAGTAAASTGPLKFTSGALLTVPEAGVVEYLSGSYYLTNAAATPLRRKFASEEYLDSRGLSLITNGSGGLLDNTNFTGHTYDQAETYSGVGSFRVNLNSADKFSNEYIPVEIGKRYILSLYAKSGDYSGGNYNAANKQSFGIALYDIDKNVIEAHHSSKTSESTDTTLAVALNPGDTTITLADATGWYSGVYAPNRNIVWFGYANSYGYTYPDYSYSRFVSSTYSSNYSLGAWDVGGVTGNVITLRVPWAGPGIAAGVAVRNLSYGTTYKYIALNKVAVPNTWTSYSGYIGPGVPVNAVDAVNLFRPGVAFIRFLHLVNYHGAADNNVRLSGISLNQLSSANLESQVGIGATYKTALQSTLPPNGLAVEGNTGFGTTNPSAKVHSVATTEQFRIGYDAANYASFIVNSMGQLKMAAPLTWRPPSSYIPSANGDLTVEATSNTSLTFRLKGTDGTVRSASLTLS